MVDMHRHLPKTDEPQVPKDWIIWYATSDTTDWEQLRNLPYNAAHRHGYGLLPMTLSTRANLDSTAIDNLSSELEVAIKDDPLGYVGEIGLDERFSVNIPLEVQFSFALECMQVAQRWGRPTVIHHIGPMPLLEKLLKKASPSTPVVIHGYLKSVESARRLTSLGATVSLGPPVWHGHTKLGDRLADFDVPFLLETDYPFVSEELLGKYTFTTLCANHLKHISLLMHREAEEIEEQVDGQATLFTYW